jgi:hypothetical protein
MPAKPSADSEMPNLSAGQLEANNIFDSCQLEYLLGGTVTAVPF